jgi:hypothetical protein
MAAPFAVGMAICLVVGTIALLVLAASGDPVVVRGHEVLRTSSILGIVAAAAGVLYLAGRLQQAALLGLF